MLVVRLVLILPKWLFFISSLATITIAIKTRMSAPFSRKSTHFFSCLICHAMKSQFGFQVAFHTHHIAYFVHLLCVIFFSLAFPSYILLSGCYFTRILEINQRNSRHDALVLMPFRCYCNEYKTSSAVAAVPPLLQWSGKKVKIAKASFVFTWEAFMPTFHSIYFYEWPSRDTQTLAYVYHNAKPSFRTNKQMKSKKSFDVHICTFTVLLH